jgi:hypothetical protein
LQVKIADQYANRYPSKIRRYLNPNQKEITMKTRNWQLLTILTLLVILLAACGASYVRGSGNVITEQREVSGFNGINMAGYGEVIITQGDTESLTIETDENLMQYIQTEVRNNTLYIEFTDKIIPDPSLSITFNLSVTNLESLELAGAGSFDIKSLETPSLGILFDGAGNIKLGSLSADELTVQLNGAGSINAAGEVGNQDVTISGAGRYSTPDLKSSQADVLVEGLGQVEIWVTDTLTVNIEGAGSVNYYGSPSVTQNVEGAGSIQSMGAK